MNIRVLTRLAWTAIRVSASPISAANSWDRLSHWRWRWNGQPLTEGMARVDIARAASSGRSVRSAIASAISSRPATPAPARLRSNIPVLSRSSPRTAVGIDSPASTSRRNGTVPGPGHPVSAARLSLCAGRARRPPVQRSTSASRAGAGSSAAVGCRTRLPS
ncbi:hypothetical protein [Kitasatospora sp. P5_F3]